MFYGILRKLYRNFNFRAVNSVQNRERIPLEVQRAYLRQFQDPEDDFQRAYFKYKCFVRYCYYDRVWLHALYNAGAAVIYPFLYRKLIKKRLMMGRTAQTDTVDAVIENVPRLPNTDILPEAVVKRYQNICEVKELNYRDIYLNETAADICKELERRYPRRFYFRLIVMIKLALFSQYIDQYHPRDIVFYSVEREFSGPLQTLLCERCGMRYEAFMHGDYLYTLSFAFQRYSKYYIWDSAYNKMLEQLKCVSPTVVYRPDKLRGTAKKLEEHDCTYFASYYFSDESEESVKKISEIFREFRERGLRCKVRPHPRFSNLALIHQYFVDTDVEDINAYPLAQSITDSLYIIGLSTTVLSEAFFSGKRVVIDDVSNEVQYRELVERGYIMMSRRHERLSALMCSVKENRKEYGSSCRFLMSQRM